MLRAFRLAGRAGSVVQYGWRLRRGRIHGEVLVMRRGLQSERDFAVTQRRFPGVDNNDPPQFSERRCDPPHLVQMFLLRDDGGGARVRQAHEERLIAKRGEQRLRDGTRFQNPEKPDV